MGVSGELLQDAAASSAEAERMRRAARELQVAADEARSLVTAVAGRFGPATWDGQSARRAEDLVHRLRDRLQGAAGELDGVAWALVLRAERLADSAEQLRSHAAAALAAEAAPAPGPFGSP